MRKTTKTTAEPVAEQKTEPKDTRLIREITLRNILSFGPDTPPFELRPLNVLIGANGSGKSNLIDCIEIIRSLPIDIMSAIRKIGGGSDIIWKGDPEVEDIFGANAFLGVVLRNIYGSSERYLSHQITITNAFEPNEFYVFKESISDENSKIYYTNKGDKRNALLGDSQELMDITIDKRISSKSILTLPGINIKHVDMIASSYQRITIYRDWQFGRNTIFRIPQRADMPNFHLAEDYSNLGLFLNYLRRKPKAKNALLTSLRDLYEEISDFDVRIEGGSVQVFFTEGDWIIPATRLSDGTLRYLCLLAILCDPEPPPLICIEEPELGLHPDVLGGLAELLIEASTRTQLIVTTHSDILVEAMTDTPESVVVCEKHEGKTELHRLTKGEVEPWLDKYRLGELWLRGGIGGKRW